MSDSEAAQEPTMEEILASIRRIISEDEESEPAEEAQPEAAAEEEVLELTEVVDEAKPEPEPEPEAVAEPAPEPKPEPAPAPPAVVEDDVVMVDRDPAPVEELGEDILSPETETQVATVMGELSRNMSLREGYDAQTVEGLVREMLRPMLQGWLDENLPPLVERIVEREIKRVSRGH